MGHNGERLDPGRWGSTVVRPGERAEVEIMLSESYSSADTKIPVFVWRGARPGPTVFVTAAVHGDEINGTGAIRHIIVDQPFDLRAGTLLLVPVVNILGFERHSRYLPDRRDLNRSFPGLPNGSMTSRMAYKIFNEIVRRSDFGIDLHTAAIRRTNFPNVRADLSNDQLADLARSFGTELIVDSTGPKGSLRRSACKAGCPTFILEAGEVWKVESMVVEYVLRGLRNSLIHLQMIDGEPEPPTHQIETRSTKWVRAHSGGFLQFHIAPGDIVQKNQPIATNTSLTGREQNVILAPRHGVVLGMTTLPSVAPGDAVVHLAFPRKASLKKLKQAQGDTDELHDRARQELASNVFVNKAEEVEH